MINFLEDGLNAATVEEAGETEEEEKKTATARKRGQNKTRSRKTPGNVDVESGFARHDGARQGGS